MFLVVNHRQKLEAKSLDISFVVAPYFQRHVTLYKPRLEECLRETKMAKGLPADAPNDSLLPKSARRHVFPR